MLQLILPSIDIQDGVSALQTLLSQIEDDSDPTTGLSEPLLNTSFNSKADEDARHNFVKDKSEVVEYLKNHFSAWKDYDPSQDFKVSRTRGKKEIKLEKIAKVKNMTIDRNGKNSVVADSTKTNNVREYGRDINNVDDINIFGLDREKNIVVRKENCNENKTSAVNKRNKHVENNIDVYKPKKVKVGKVQEAPTIIRNVGIMKEFETKARKRKTKPINVDIKTIKKAKIEMKTASSGKIHNKTGKKDAKVNGNPKYTVYRPEEDPKLIYSPKVVIKANLISDYEEKMRLKKAKKLKTEYKDNNSTKIDKEHNKNNLISYNRINKNHTLTKTHKQTYNSDENNHQTKIKNNKDNHNNNNDDNNNHNEDNDNNVTTDSGLGTELPRWSSLVDTYTAEIETSLTFILGNM